MLDFNRANFYCFPEHPKHTKFYAGLNKPPGIRRWIFYVQRESFADHKRGLAEQGIDVPHVFPSHTVHSFFDCEGAKPPKQDTPQWHSDNCKHRAAGDCTGDGFATLFARETNATELADLTFCFLETHLLDTLEPCTLDGLDCYFSDDTCHLIDEDHDLILVDTRVRHYGATATRWPETLIHDGETYQLSGNTSLFEASGEVTCDECNEDLDPDCSMCDGDRYVELDLVYIAGYARIEEEEEEAEEV